jgi:hypothetical protein
MRPLDFGLFYEIPVAAPWKARSERDAYHDVIAQAVHGERVGFTHFWTVEHHFLSEFSHCSAPGYPAPSPRRPTMRIVTGAAPPVFKTTRCAPPRGRGADLVRRAARGTAIHARRSRASASSPATRAPCGRRRST